MDRPSSSVPYKLSADDKIEVLQVFNFDRARNIESVERIVIFPGAKHIALDTVPADTIRIADPLALHAKRRRLISPYVAGKHIERRLQIWAFNSAREIGGIAGNRGRQRRRGNLRPHMELSVGSVLPISNRKAIFSSTGCCAISRTTKASGT